MKTVLLLLLLAGKPELVQDPPRPQPGGLVFLSIKGTGIKSASVLSSRQDVPCRMVQERSGDWLAITQAPTSGGLTVFVAVSAEELHHWRHEVTGGGPGPGPPPDPPQPPGPTVYYFLVVRADGPASPEFTRIMSDPAWAELKARGHSYKDKTVTEAGKLGLVLPPGQALPVVVTLVVSPDGKKSTEVRGPIPLPSSSEAIRRLPEGVK